METEYCSQEITPSLSHSFVERKGIIIFPNQQSNSEFELCFQRNQLAAFLSSSVDGFSTEVEELLPVWILKVVWVVPFDLSLTILSLQYVDVNTCRVTIRVTSF